MNDSRIFGHPEDCRSSDSERGFVKKKFVCTLRSAFLAPEQREDRVTSCKDIITKAYEDKLLCQNYYTWCFAQDPETKRQNLEWVGEASPLIFRGSRIENILINYFRISRRTAVFIPVGKTVNEEL
jgi:hypothetical protein